MYRWFEWGQILWGGSARVRFVMVINQVLSET